MDWLIEELLMTDEWTDLLNLPVLLDLIDLPDLLNLLDLLIEDALMAYSDLFFFIQRLWIQI